MRRALPLFFVLLPLAAACTGGASGIDGGDLDGGSTGDAGRRDSGPFHWPVETATVVITPSADWKNRISRDDPFVMRLPAFETPIVPWAKLTVLMKDPSKVYYQNAFTHPFHADFIRARLDPYLGLSPEQIDAKSLHEEGQELIRGVVYFSTRPEQDEIGIRLDRDDPYHPEMARIVLDLIRRSIDTATTTRIFYFPGAAQVASAQESSAFFQAAGFPIGSLDRFDQDGACYNPGIAVGTLRAEPSAAGPGDVLLLEEPPAELPTVGGLVIVGAASETAALTRAARSRGIAFGRLGANAAQARALVGQPVVLRVEGLGGCQVDVFAAGELPPAMATELLGLTGPPDPAVPAKTRVGAYAASVDSIGASDVPRYGEQSASYGAARNAAADISPAAVAISFDLFEDYLDQPRSGQTLRALITEKLGGRTFPADLTAIREGLAAIRAAIRDTPLSASLRTALADATAPLGAQLELRPSTNVDVLDRVESEGLLVSATSGTGAALESAARAVFASFYAEGPAIERLRRGIGAEASLGLWIGPIGAPQIGDAEAVVGGSPSFHTLRWSAQTHGASIRDPSSLAQTELIDISSFGGNVYPTLLRTSSERSPGASILAFPDAYASLTPKLNAITERWHTLHPGHETTFLEIALAIHEDGSVSVRGIHPRPIPPSADRDALLIGTETELCVRQGESGTVFGNHRLKSRFRIHTRSSWLRDRSVSFYEEVGLDWFQDGQRVTTSGPLSARPGFMHGSDADSLRDAWMQGTTQLELDTTARARVPGGQQPVVVLTELYPVLKATYQTPVLTVDPYAGQSTTSDDWAVLGACPERNRVGSSNPRQVRTATASQGRSIEIAFWWPEPPRGATAGYTAPLYRWDQTTLSGFSAAPIVLKGYASQTYRPEHHNFGESFLFEPRLEEGIDPAVVQELEAAGIRAIHVMLGLSQRAAVGVVGPDGSYRRL
ncbi:MAG: hypothetical protein U1E65_09865 [Myxococcota bacterium]